ncbi:ABC transporter ATP-binding protein [Alicyclobacillus contaminans]|uniref:ABC transporter ATP-binding protein n=1 Tax=Alicyclobacillus contaminans TaxID=392016 RepID=UPI000425C083|nr:ABC transporter ATP-binding protein [Alicyclobacillus contaminans]GMA49819.1 ABC transporter ATP-binding protein [Alicyclobacillus contaminans]
MTHGTAAKGQTAIRVAQVHKSFGRKHVLRDITLTVESGEIFGLLGPSGSGKTTLVKLIAGLDDATSGEVEVAGVRMPSLGMLSKIGYMAQSDALYTELTAKENLAFFASLYGLSGVQRAKRMAEVMELVNLSDAMNGVVSAYSGGMKRRLSLAIALLHQPGILILDEPTVGIDPVLRKAVWDELKRMSEAGTTILVTTHVMDEAEKCHRLGLIRNGVVMAVGTPEQLKQDTGAGSVEEAFLVYGGGEQ